MLKSIASTSRHVLAHPGALSYPARRAAIPAAYGALPRVNSVGSRRWIETGDALWQRRRYWESVAHYITTLDPARLTTEDYMDISKKEFGVFTTKGVPRQDGWLPTQKFSRGPKGLFPEGTAGFLYLHKPPPNVGIPEWAGELRFRVTYDQDPKSFARGKDFMNNGLPWSFPLIHSYLPLTIPLIQRHLLFSKKGVIGLQRMINEIQQIEMNARPSANWKGYFAQTLYSRAQPFIVHFFTIRQRLWVLKEVNGVNRSKQVHIPLPVKEMYPQTPFGPYEPNLRRRVSRFRPLYTGVAVVRLEWKEDTRRGPQTMLRILKVVEPIVPVESGLEELKAGDLVPIMDPGTRLPHDSWFVRTHQSHAGAILYGLPDVPVDTEYTGDSTSTA